MRPAFLISSVALLAASLGAAPAHADEAKIAAAVKTINENATVRSIRDIPGLGLKEVIADNSVIYMDPNGRYLFFGTLLDLESKRNLSQEAQASVRVDSIRGIPASEKIIFAPKDVKHRVTVFTDITCSFCQKLHDDLDGYLERGIAVEYVAFPRGGQRSPAWQQMRNIWCAKDRKGAYEAGLAGQSVPATVNCSDPVASHYALGDTLSIEGTPALFTESGTLLSGYMPPDRLLAALEKDAKDNGR